MSNFSTNQKFAILLISGIGFLGWELFSAFRSFEASSSWEATTAMVTQSELRRYRSYSRRRSSGSYRREVEIEYTYQVNGKSYTGSRVSFGQSFISNSLDLFKSETVKKYPKGERVTVYFNPSAPSDSVLETQLPISAYLVIIIAGGMCLFASVKLFATDLKPAHPFAPEVVGIPEPAPQNS